ncbi:haloalkane dehalogenase 2-like [Lolium rigidum]|uniref:haloalkane dehalogenase 2-like n=1 Tax=Lolium rigidum TaxID=89674 RepID=UPI001F5D8F0B|nr:haloalkane dehalogenase 2-like [Lolium rigidum]
MSGCPCPCSTCASASSPLSLLPSIPADPRRSSFAFPSSRGGPRRRGLRVVVAASSKDEKAEAEEGDPAFNPFGFVTDNPSSRTAIQLPESPAQDGNVGQMLYRTEDKGREYGKSVRSGEFRWFVRETGSPDARRGTVMFIHGAPTQSFSYRTVMAQMTDAGYHCFAPDWIGFGFSEMPQPGYGFDYKEEEFHKAFDELLGTLNITEPFYLVVQGFIVGSYGLTWALKNPSKLRKVAILNSPLTVSSPVPGVIKQLRLPLFGEFTCQNAILAERFIEAGSPYVLKSEKADVYRLPYLSSGAPGFALLEAARKANFQDVLSRISAGFSSNSWEIPILLAWGESDKYLPLSIAEEFQKSNPKVVKLKTIEGAGHMPQEDWPEKVVSALTSFLF